MANNNSTVKKVVLDIQVTDDEGVANIMQLTKAIDELKLKQASLKKANATNTPEYIKNDAAIKNLTASLKANQKALQNNIDRQKANDGSLKEMRANLKILSDEYSNLSRAERESASGTALRDQIKEQRDALFELERAIGDSTRGVGEYERAFDPLAKALENPKAALKDLTKEIIKMKLEMANSKGEIEAQERIVEEMGRTYGETSQEYQQAVEKLNLLKKGYEDTGKAVNSFEQEAGNLRDVISDTNKRIGTFADDEARINAMRGGVDALSGAFDVLQGIVASTGKDSQALVEIYAKMEIVQKSLNGVLKVAQTLNKDSAVMTQLQAKWMPIRNAYQQTYNAQLKAQNIATAASIPLMTSLRAGVVAVGAAIKTAFLSNPIGILLVAITSVIPLITKMIEKRKEAKRAAEEEAKANRDLAKAYGDSVKERAKSQGDLTADYDREIVKVRELYSIIKKSSAGYSEKAKAMDELRRMGVAFNGVLDNTGRLVKDDEAAITSYISKLSEKAKAEAQTAMLTQAYENQLLAAREVALVEYDRKWYKSQMDKYQSIVDMQRSFRGTALYSAEIENNATNNVEWYTKKFNQTANAYTRATQDLQKANREIEVTLSKVTVTTTLLDSNDSKGVNVTDKAQTEIERNIKTIEDALKGYTQEYESWVDENERTAEEVRTRQYESFKKTITEQIEYVQKYNPERLDLITNLQTELSNAERAYQADIAKIKADAAAKMKEDAAKMDEEAEKIKAKLQEIQAKYDEVFNAKKYEETIKGQYDKKVDDAGAQYAADNEVLKQALANQLITYEEYKKRQFELAETYNKEIAKADRWLAAETIKSHNEMAQNVFKAASAIVDAMKQMLNAFADDNEKYSDFLLGLSIANIAINTASSIGAAIAGAAEAASAGGPAAPYLLIAYIAQGIAAVMAGIAEATAAIKQAREAQAQANVPRFARGGLVVGPGTGTSDDVPSRLSNGEYVLQSSIVRTVGVKRLDSLNGGDFGALSGFSPSAMYESTKLAFTEALSEMPNPVVSVKEITRVQNRVTVKEKTATH